jgi:hypothetical protein
MKNIICFVALVVLTACADITGPTDNNSTARRVGAICNDGTKSSATGSGACSSHGGVRVWIYG